MRRQAAEVRQRRSLAPTACSRTKREGAAAGANVAGRASSATPSSTTQAAHRTRPYRRFSGCRRRHRRSCEVRRVRSRVLQPLTTARRRRQRARSQARGQRCRLTTAGEAVHVATRRTGRRAAVTARHRRCGRGGPTAPPRAASHIIGDVASAAIRGSSGSGSVVSSRAGTSSWRSAASAGRERTSSTLPAGSRR